MDRVSTPPVTIPEKRVFFGLLDQLRAVAALAVVWSHLVGFFLGLSGQSWPPASAVALLIGRPAGIVDDFGWFGVAVFFFISGFVITHAARRESGPVFIVRRVLRIYPPVVFAILVVIVIGYVRGYGPTSPAGDPLSGWQIVANFTLADAFFAPSSAILSVTWTLAIEMTFYLCMWALIPLVRRVPWLASLILVVVFTLPTLLIPDGIGGFRPGSVFLFAPLLVLGQVLYLARMRLVPLWGAALLGGAAWTSFLFGLHRIGPDRLTPDNNHPANAILAFALVVIAVLLEGRVRPSRIVAVVARRSYSLYLMHTLVGLLVLTLLHEAGSPYTLNLVVALVVVALATEACYRLAERPGIVLGRRLSARLRRDPEPAARTLET